ncbi:hypothetical protein AMS68_003426 [Peltaster fructicola]|uniref:Nicotinamide-nucleotide adenylyltransferase n=1 Tax=Peltaster fructicola TaxID=286661 RepID=A0A6H0XTG5_9PEZI|nr:hypothetical protein AMS68_003426 [Peltaster fructicola]
MAGQRSFRALLQSLQHGLKGFQESQATFKILASVDFTLQPTTTVNVEEVPRTLFVLDSSFNPPSIAHQSLVETALHASEAYAKPHRLLLLFSTMNADKAPSAASFDQRLTMMAIFASDLLGKLKQDGASVVPIDIGVTTAPYYTDKSIAIEQKGPYGQSKHVHLIGYDTLTRVFAAKYYSKFNPPFSALDPYFNSGHEFRATLRPDEDGNVDEQKDFLSKLECGALEDDGGKPMSTFYSTMGAGREAV